MNQESFFKAFQEKHNELETGHISTYYGWTKILKSKSFERFFSMIHPLQYPINIEGHTDWLSGLQKNLQIRTAELPYYSKEYIDSFVSEVKRLWSTYFLNSFEAELNSYLQPRFLTETQWKTYRLSSLMNAEKKEQPFIISQDDAQVILEHGSRLLETLTRYVFQHNRYATKKENHFSFLVEQLIPYILFFKQKIPKYWDFYGERLQLTSVSNILSNHFKTSIETKSYTKETVSMYRELNPCMFLPYKEDFRFRETSSEHPFSFYYRYYDDVKEFLPNALHQQFQEVLLYPFELLEKSDRTTEKYQNILAYTKHFENLLKGEGESL